MGHFFTQSPDLEFFGHLEKGRKSILLDLSGSEIEKLEEAFDVGRGEAAKTQDGMFSVRVELGA